MTVTDERPSAQPTTVAATDAARRDERWRALRRRAVPRPRTARHGMTAVLSAALAALFVWVILYALVLTSFVHSRAQDVRYAQFREQLALATAPLGGSITVGAPVGVMSMPSAGIRDEVVVEGTASGQLTGGPGHRRDTPLPGQPGVSVIYGRSTLFGSPFDRITAARPGAVITVTTGLGVAKYLVTDVRRAGDPFPAALAANGGRLTLVTSEGSGWRAGWAPDHTVFVDAVLASKPAGTLAGRPAAVPTSETAMHGDTGALYVLVLLLPLLLSAVLLALWSQQRWGRWQAWIIGFPLVLGCLWACSQQAVQLLPNLL